MDNVAKGDLETLVYSLIDEWEEQREMLEEKVLLVDFLDEEYIEPEEKAEQLKEEFGRLLNCLIGEYDDGE